MSFTHSRLLGAFVFITDWQLTFTDWPVCLLVHVCVSLWHYLLSKRIFFCCMPVYSVCSLSMSFLLASISWVSPTRVPCRLIQSCWSFLILAASSSIWAISASTLICRGLRSLCWEWMHTNHKVIFTIHLIVKFQCTYIAVIFRIQRSFHWFIHINNRHPGIKSLTESLTPVLAAIWEIFLL